MRAGLARLFLTVALLAGWQAALLHPLQHVNGQGGLVHVTDGESGKTDSGSSGLCDALAALTACAPVAPPALQAAHRGSARRTRRRIQAARRRGAAFPGTGSSRTSLSRSQARARRTARIWRSIGRECRHVPQFMLRRGACHGRRQRVGAGRRHFEAARSAAAASAAGAAARKAASRRPNRRRAPSRNRVLQAHPVASTRTFPSFCKARPRAARRIPTPTRSAASRPRAARSSPAPRGFGLGESELIITSNVDPYFRGQLVAALTPEDEVEVEEAFLPDARARAGLHAEGRPLPVRHRLSERDPPARLGFPGRAARVQGVPRRAAERRRRAAALGRADRSIRRARRRARPRTQLPRDRPQQERRERRERVRPRRRRHRREHRVARRAVVPAAPRRRTALSRTSTRSAAR